MVTSAIISRCNYKRELLNVPKHGYSSEPVPQSHIISGESGNLKRFTQKMYRLQGSTVYSTAYIAHHGRAYVRRRKPHTLLLQINLKLICKGVHLRENRMLDRLLKITFAKAMLRHFHTREIATECWGRSRHAYACKVGNIINQQMFNFHWKAITIFKR